ncbi:hypothetical protein [Spirosoma pomorum]
MNRFLSVVLLAGISAFVSISANGQAKNTLSKSPDYSIKAVHPKPDSIKPAFGLSTNLFRNVSDSANNSPIKKDLPDYL